MVMARRVGQLYVGLAAYAVSMALLVRARLGVMPWDVLHQGLSRRVGHSMGFWVIVVGAIVLLSWIPLRERPGIGTVSNIVVIGVMIDVVLAVLPVAHLWALRVGYVAGGISINALATALYVGARLGPGPRDGLMTGLVRRTGRSIRLVRTSMEVTVVVIGFALGGSLGPATLAYALCVGPLVHLLLPRLTVPESSREAARRVPVPTLDADSLAA